MNKLRNIIKHSLLCVRAIYKDNLDLTDKGINTLTDIAEEEILDLIKKTSRNEQLLEEDICSLVKAELITMSRAKEILCIKHMDMRKIYQIYAKKEKEDTK